MKLVSKHWVYILSCNSLPLRSTPQHDDFDKRKVTKFILFFPIIYRSRSRSPSHIAFLLSVQSKIQVTLCWESSWLHPPDQ